MLGPFLISDVNSKIKTKSPGAYILSRNGTNAHFVGRSDSDILNAIKSKAETDSSYTQFFYEVTPSDMEAYYLECKWYHKYLPPDNNKHPSTPPNVNWRCPIKGCPWA